MSNFVIKGEHIPPCGQLNPSVTNTLKDLAYRIYVDYYNGQKRDARARFRSIPQQRQVYVSMWFGAYAAEMGRMDDYYNFVCSLTE